MAGFPPRCDSRNSESTEKSALRAPAAKESNSQTGLQTVVRCNAGSGLNPENELVIAGPLLPFVQSAGFWSLGFLWPSEAAQHLTRSRPAASG